MGPHQISQFGQAQSEWGTEHPHFVHVHFCGVCCWHFVSSRTNFIYRILAVFILSLFSAGYWCQDIVRALSPIHSNTLPFQITSESWWFHGCLWFPPSPSEERRCKGLAGPLLGKMNEIKDSLFLYCIPRWRDPVNSLWMQDIIKIKLDGPS